MTDEDITALIQRVCLGRDEEAAAQLWNVYFRRLIPFARQGLGALSDVPVDEEDIALSALNSFFKAAEAGRFESIDGRDELWKLLLTITLRKVNRQLEYYSAIRRGGPGTSDIPDATPVTATALSPNLSQVPDHRLISDLILECQEMLQMLPEETLRAIATARLEGFTVSEIAARRGVAVGTVERKLARIRRIWMTVRDAD